MSSNVELTGTSFDMEKLLQEFALRDDWKICEVFDFEAVAKFFCDQTRLLDGVEQEEGNTCLIEPFAEALQSNDREQDDHEARLRNAGFNAKADSVATVGDDIRMRSNVKVRGSGDQEVAK